MTTLIKLRFSTTDRFSESRTFKTLKGARKYAHEKIGTHPEISRQWGYAVGKYGDSKIEIREGTTFAELFPGTAAAEPEVELKPVAVEPERISPSMGWRAYYEANKNIQAISVPAIRGLLLGCQIRRNERVIALEAECKAELAARGES